MKINIEKIIKVGAGLATIAFSLLTFLYNEDEFNSFLKNASDEELDTVAIQILTKTIV